MLKEELNKPADKPGPERGGLPAGLGSQRRHLTHISKDKLTVDLLRWVYGRKGHLGGESSLYKQRHDVGKVSACLGHSSNKL